MADIQGVFVYFPNGPWYSRPGRTVGQKVMLSAGNSLRWWKDNRMKIIALEESF